MTCPSPGPSPDQRLDRFRARAQAARRREDLMALSASGAEDHDAQHDAVGFPGHRTAASTLPGLRLQRQWFDERRWFPMDEMVTADAGR